MPNHSLLIYGAYGYTGRLVAVEARRLGLTPVLAGRNHDRVSAMAGEYGWPFRSFSLENESVVADNLAGIQVVLHCAGPFRYTAAPMIAACLRTGTHYLDINGEIDVFAHAASCGQQAVAANLMLMPGVGFDVVPSDYLAWRLAKAMPDATQLYLAFVTLGGQISHGTASSMINRLGENGTARLHGELVPEPIARHTMTIHAGGKQLQVMSIPWGDVFTAWHTTGIPNIRTFTGARPSQVRLARMLPVLAPLLRTRLVQRWLQAWVDRRPAGPDAAKRARAKTYLWGRVTNAAGSSREAWFSCAEGYTLTAVVAVGIAQWVLAGHWKPGYQTPAGCYGEQLATIVPFIEPLQEF